MLVVSRKEHESIVINGNITVVVLGICGGKVRLGIEAPNEVPVHREEVAAKQSRLRTCHAEVHPRDEHKKSSDD